MFQAFCTLQTAYTHTPNNNNKEPLTPGLRLFAPTAFHTNNTNSLCASHLHSKQSNHLKAIKSHRKAIEKPLPVQTGKQHCATKASAVQ
jgi:hypothetical protein